MTQQINIVANTQLFEDIKKQNETLYNQIVDETIQSLADKLSTYMVANQRHNIDYQIKLQTQDQLQKIKATIKNVVENAIEEQIKLKVEALTKDAAFNNNVRISLHNKMVDYGESLLKQQLKDKLAEKLGE